MKVALMAVLVQSAILVTSYRTQTQSVKLAAQQEHMKVKLVTGNVKIVYQTVIVALIPVLVPDVLRTTTYKTGIQNAKLFVHQGHIKIKLVLGHVKIV